MNTAKHLNGSSLRPLPKKPFRFWIKKYLPAMLFSSLCATMIDLYFVGSHIYSYPIRPLAEVFTINIIFTLVVLPLLIVFLLSIMEQLNWGGKSGVILLISLVIPIIEKLAEVLGLFVHSAAWNHFYSFLGYLTFLTVIYLFHVWITNKQG